MRKKEITLLFFVFLSCYSCTALFFYPEKDLIYNSQLERFSYNDIYFNTNDDVLLHGWLIRAKGEQKGTILHFHGNAENISTHVNNVLWLADSGYDIFTFDYRGYGKSGGVTTIDGVHKDAITVLDSAIGQSSSKKGGFFVIGQSLGGAIAIYAVAKFQDKKKIKALIVDSAFTGYRAIVREKMKYFPLINFLGYLFLPFFDDYYSPSIWIKKVSPVPVLIIHGTNDRVVSFKNGIELFNSADKPKEFWEIKGGEHIQAFRDVKLREKFLQYLKDNN